MEKEIFNLIQISDLHILKKNKKLLDVDTTATFIKITNYLQNIKKDYLLITGDLSQDGSHESYSLILEKLNELKIPTIILPGNHDNVLNMNQIFQNNIYLLSGNSILIANWRFLIIDTNIPNKDHGYINDDSIAFIKRKITKMKQNEKCCLIMHHHPAPTNTSLIDEFIIENHENFMQEISKLNKIDLIICGHVHNNYLLQCKNIPIETGPSTAFQFPKGVNKLTLDQKIGFNYFSFYEDSYSVKNIYI